MTVAGALPERIPVFRPDTFLPAENREKDDRMEKAGPVFPFFSVVCDTVPGKTFATGSLCFDRFRLVRSMPSTVALLSEADREVKHV